MIRDMGTLHIHKMFRLKNAINKITINHNYPIIPINANAKYVKYTHRSTQYKMLDSDSLFMFCSELSNDKTENKLLPVDEKCDVFMTCFYHNKSSSDLNGSDLYSQWMSYCQGGGAAFEFYFGQSLIGEPEQSKDYDKYIEEKMKGFKLSRNKLFDYSILIKDPKSPSDYIKYPHFPFQVQYFEQNFFDDDTYRRQIEINTKEYGMSLFEILPYFKHSGFIQESEARLAFINFENILSKCINFMQKDDGTKLPYINVKFGNADDENKPCDFVKVEKGSTLTEAVNKKISEIPFQIKNSKCPIVIPQGRDQEEVFNVVEKVVNEYNKDKSQDNKLKIICQGHLPITKITLAPTEDRVEQKKMMEIYCKSKYWLRNVEICESTIPYNTKNSNHA